MSHNYLIKWSHKTISLCMVLACKTAVCGSYDKTVKLWDLGSCRCMIETYGQNQDKYDIMHEAQVGQLLLCFWYQLQIEGLP